PSAIRSGSAAWATKPRAKKPENKIDKDFIKAEYQWGMAGQAFNLQSLFMLRCWFVRWGIRIFVGLLRQEGLDWLCFIEACFGKIQLVDHAFVAHRIDVTRFVDAKGDESLRNPADLANGLQS